jgi:hypothetical protein
MTELREILNQVTLHEVQDTIVESICVNFHQITHVFAAI